MTFFYTYLDLFYHFKHRQMKLIKRCTKAGSFYKGLENDRKKVEILFVHI